MTSIPLMEHGGSDDIGLSSADGGIDDMLVLPMEVLSDTYLLLMEVL